MGLEVTLLQFQPRVLARVTAAELSAFYEAEHRASGDRLMQAWTALLEVDPFMTAGE